MIIIIFFRVFEASSFYKASNPPARLTHILSKVEVNTSVDPLTITILPPENAAGFITDEDPGDEDGGGQ